MASGQADPAAIANQFIPYYYKIFDENRAQAAQFFTEQSTYSFEGSTHKGVQSITQKLSSLQIPMGTKRTVSTKDAQPSAVGSGAIVVFVTGEWAGQLYQETFQLVPTGSGSYYVHNGIFRVGNNNPFNSPPEAVEVTKAFIQHYFTLYDTNRQQLSTLYRNNSCLSQEGTNCGGPQQIMERLTTLPKVKHDGNSLTVDVQCVNGIEILFMFISGQLLIEGQSNPLKFAQMFQLFKEGQGYFIGNQVFRLNYGG